MTARFTPGPVTLRNTAMPALIAALTMFIPAAALILAGNNSGRAAWDATAYHEPFIRQLAASWPHFDLSNPLTTTTPGFHMLLAGLARIGLDSTSALRLTSALIGACLAALVAGWCARRVRPLDAVLLALPLSCSVYVLGCSAWAVPDNLSWIGVAGILMLCLREPGSWRLLLGASLALTALVFTRQIHIWIAATIWLTAWLGFRGPWRAPFTGIPERLPRTLAAIALTLPAFLIVAWFVRLWGGAVPPRFQSSVTGLSPATPAFILVQTAILWFGFAPWLLPACTRAWRERRWVLVLGALLGLMLVILPPTTENWDLGRYSGWWRLAGAAPVIAGRTSLPFLLLAPLGGVLIAGSLSGAPARARWVLLGSLVAFTAAQSSTSNSWQRYHEPFLIILLAVTSALQNHDLRPAFLTRLRIPAMLALCLMLAGMSAMSFFRTERFEPGVRPTPEHTSPDDPWYKAGTDEAAGE